MDTSGRCAEIRGGRVFVIAVYRIMKAALFSSVILCAGIAVVADAGFVAILG
jgi:hypothetical protein